MSSDILQGYYELRNNIIAPKQIIINDGEINCVYNTGVLASDVCELSVRMEIPRFPVSNNNDEFEYSWPKFVGTHILKSASIDDYNVEKKSSLELSIDEVLFHPANRFQNECSRKMLGDVPELTSIKKILPAYTIFLPLLDGGIRKEIRERNRELIITCRFIKDLSVILCSYQDGNKVNTPASYSIPLKIPRLLITHAIKVE